MTPVKDVTSEAQLDRILSSLDDDKAEDVVQIDLRGKSALGDFMVICSGRSSRQVSSISEKLADRLKQELGILCKVEGKEAGGLGADRHGRCDRPCLPPRGARVLPA